MACVTKIDFESGSVKDNADIRLDRNENFLMAFSLIKQILGEGILNQGQASHSLMQAQDKFQDLVSNNSSSMNVANGWLTGLNIGSTILTVLTVVVVAVIVVATLATGGLAGPLLGGLGFMANMASCVMGILSGGLQLGSGICSGVIAGYEGQNTEYQAFVQSLTDVSQFTGEKMSQAAEGTAKLASNMNSVISAEGSIRNFK